MRSPSRRTAERKVAVEECLRLDMTGFRGSGLGAPSGATGGEVVWRDGTTGKVQSSVGFQWTRAGQGLVMLLRYTSFLPDGTSHAVNEPIRLEASRPCFGGKRWWFICPLTKNGQYCGRRVRVLYQRPGCIYFRCRHCYDLTYLSIRAHDRRKDQLRKLPIEGLLAIIRSSGRAKWRFMACNEMMRRWEGLHL